VWRAGGSRIVRRQCSDCRGRTTTRDSFRRGKAAGCRRSLETREIAAGGNWILRIAAFRIRLKGREVRIVRTSLLLRRSGTRCRVLLLRTAAAAITADGAGSILARRISRSAGRRSIGSRDRIRRLRSSNNSRKRSRDRSIGVSIIGNSSSSRRGRIRRLRSNSNSRRRSRDHSIASNSREVLSGRSRALIRSLSREISIIGRNAVTRLRRSNRNRGAIRSHSRFTSIRRSFRIAAVVVETGAAETTTAEITAVAETAAGVINFLLPS
jgi:hypothetical protein